jgi:DNA-binding MarR family transcriptional regulator
MQNSQLASALRSVISNLHKTLRRQLPVAGTYSMTEIETIALLMRNERLLPSELASLTRVKTQSMSQIINKLEANEVVRRTPSRADKRKVYISLTAAGKKMIEKNIYERDEKLKEAIEHSLDKKEKELLQKAVGVLNKLLEHI